MTKIMYRNRLEKLKKYHHILFACRCFMMVFIVSLIDVVVKCNYMEYLKKIEHFIKLPFCGIFKGTSQPFRHKGTSERRNSLCIIFQTWLYFFKCQKNLQRPSLGWYASFYNLVIFCKKVVIK